MRDVTPVKRMYRREYAGARNMAESARASGFLGVVIDDGELRSRRNNCIESSVGLLKES